MFRTAALTTDSYVAVDSHPSFQASLIAIVVAGVMSKEIIPRPTKLVTSKAVVIFVTHHANLVLKVRHCPIMSHCLPLVTWVDHARVDSLLYRISLTGIIIVVTGFHDQSIRPRPGEAEGQHDPALAAAVAAAAAATATGRRRLEVEGVALDDRRGGEAVAAGTVRRHPSLVLLQAHSEEGVALSPHTLAVLGVPAAAFATIPILQLPVNVLHLVHLQLELPRRQGELVSQEKAQQSKD